MLARCIYLKDKLLRPGNEFAIAEAKKIVNYVYNHCHVDTEDRFHNLFFHEICPLLLIAEHVGDEATRIVFRTANSRFDGLIFLGHKHKPHKVELTAAVDGYNDALRMELLRERGEAPAFGRIQTTGTKRNRKFSNNEPEAICSEEYDQETLRPLLKRAVKLKTEKARRNPHYTGGWLGVVFDDWIMPVNGRKKKRFDPVCQQVLSSDVGRNIPFSRVFFVGISRQYLFDSCESDLRS